MKIEICLKPSDLYVCGTFLDSKNIKNEKMKENRKVMQKVTTAE